jgi:hypothetical protein
VAAVYNRPDVPYSQGDPSKDARNRIRFGAADRRHAISWIDLEAKLGDDGAEVKRSRDGWHYRRHAKWRALKWS